MVNRQLETKYWATSENFLYLKTKLKISITINKYNYINTYS